MCTLYCIKYFLLEKELRQIAQTNHEKYFHTFTPLEYFLLIDPRKGVGGHVAGTRFRTYGKKNGKTDEMTNGKTDGGADGGTHGRARVIY